MSIETFFNSAVSLIAAVGLLLSGIVSLLALIRNHSRRKPKIRHARNMIFFLTVILLASSAFIFLGRECTPPLHEQLTSAAWNAFNKGDYVSAIAEAQECIDAYEGEALKEQEELSARCASLPPRGTVTDEEKRSIFSYGVLNDVATCYFIMGQALENLDRIEEAKEAYSGAQKFPYARTWDGNRQIFWSPADAASGRLEQLSQ
jgi:tetratricopeptide (TPR) repeat protein